MIPRVLPKIRCTAAQKMALIDYMLTHRQLARYEYDPYTAEAEWHRLAETLNQAGTVKTVDKWKVTWRDLKRKYLREVQAAEAHNKTPSEAALKIKEILSEPGEGKPRADHMHFGTSSPPALAVTVHVSPEDSYQGQEWPETDQEQSQEIEYLEPIAGDPGSPASELESIECTPDLSSDSSPCTSPTPMINTRCNQDQIDALVDCMVMNPTLAFRNQHTPKKLWDWKRLRHFLNKMGPAKRTTAWIKTWRDLKRSALEKNNSQGKYNLPSTKKIIELVAAHNEGATDVAADDDLVLRLPPKTKHHKHRERDNNKVPLNNQNSVNNSSAQLSLGQRNSGNESPAQHDFEVSVVSGRALSHREAVRASYIQYRQSYHAQFRQRYRPKTRSTNSQICALVDYMDKHPVMAIAKSTAGDTHCPYNAEWRRLSSQLNKIGTAKNTMAWKRTWRDLKKTARREPYKNRNSNVNQRILEILERAAKLPQDTAESKVDTLNIDALPFAADFDHVSSDQMSLAQHKSERSSPSQSEHEHSLENSTSNAPKKLSRCTTAQKHALVDYMVTHLALATSKFVDAIEEDPYYAEWRQLSKYLNKIGNAKSTVAWKRTWRDLKLSILKKQWYNEPLLELDKRILEICDKDPHELNIRTVQGFNSLPCPTDGMPVLYLQESPEHHLTTPDIILCDQDRYDEPSNEDSQKHSPKSPKLGEESPGRQSLEQMSPDQRFGTASPVERGQASPVQSEDGHESPKDSVPKKTRRPRSSPSQIDALVNYMFRHPSLATAKCLYTPNEKDPSYDEWRRLCKYLNHIDRSIPPKSVSKWKCTWRTLVINARRKDRKRSKWNDRVSRRILQILNEHEEAEANDISIEADTQPIQDCVYPPSPVPSERLTLSDPLKCEQDENHERLDKHNGRVPKPRTRCVRRSSNRQLRALADYMIAHPSLATKQPHIESPAWVRLTRHLNSIGPPRSPEAWKQSWKDLKLSVRARARRKETSKCLERDREKKIMKLISAKSPVCQPTEDVEPTEHPEPEVTLAPRPASPRSVLYKLAEILARDSSTNDRPENDRDRNNRDPSTAENSGVASETNDILREILQEVKRSNDLKAEQNGYIRELLQQLRTPACTHTTKQNIAEDNTTDNNLQDVQKQEVMDTEDSRHSN